MRVSSSKFARSGVAAAAVLAFGFVPVLTPTASAQPCELPDASGTVVLPDPNCPYLSPDEFHMVVDGLPPGTTIIITGIHRDFICEKRGIPQEFCNSPGGIFGPDGEIEFFESTLEMQMEGTGQLAGFQRNIQVPIFCEVNTGPRNEGDPVQTFPNEMVQLQGAIFGDPDFDALQVRAGLNFGLPSPGETTLTRLGPPGSDFNVDSFFDIFYEIDFQGAPGSILDGLAGVTRETVRMRTGEPAGPPDCLLDDSFDTYPDGSIIVPQGGWEAWDNNPAFQDGTVTSVIARSLPHSLEIDGTDDIVHQFSGVNSGRWELELYQYIPSGATGQQFMILLNGYVPGGPYNWSSQILADSDTGLISDFNNPTSNTPIINDVWILVEAEVDLDLDRQVVKYNGVTIIDDVWAGHVPPGTGGLTVAAFDLFNNGGTRVFYDDVSFCTDPNTCPADTDGNGAVDFGDILNVLGNWGPYGPCPPYKPADISRNCDVDFRNILPILGNWGPCIECLIPDADPFATLTEPGAETTVEFGSSVIPPIPPDFFNPGSDPFVGQIELGGFSADDSDLDLTDTIVRRSGPVNFPGAGFPRPSDPVQVEIVELSLTSVAPTIVTFNGGQDPEIWLVAMGLSDNQQPGVLDAILEGPDGGITQAVVPVRPRLVFAPEGDLERLAQGVINPEDVEIRIFDWDQEGLPPVNMGWADPFPFSTVPPDEGFFNECELDNPFPFFPGVPPGGADHGGGDAPNLPPHIVAGGPGHLHYVCPPPPPPPGLCTYALIGATPCIFGGGGGVCPAPPVGKILLPCGPLGPCPFFAPCPPFIIVIFPCQPPGTGFCVGFYRCIGCNPC